MYENKKGPSYMISTHCDRYGRTTEDLMQLFVKQKPACFFIILKFFLEALPADHTLHNSLLKCRRMSLNCAL